MQDGASCPSFPRRGPRPKTSTRRTQDALISPTVHLPRRPWSRHLSRLDRRARSTPRTRTPAGSAGRGAARGARLLCGSARRARERSGLASTPRACTPTRARRPVASKGAVAVPSRQSRRVACAVRSFDGDVVCAQRKQLNPSRRAVRFALDSEARIAILPRELSTNDASLVCVCELVAQPRRGVGKRGNLKP